MLLSEAKVNEAWHRSASDPSITVNEVTSTRALEESIFAQVNGFAKEKSVLSSSGQYAFSKANSHVRRLQELVEKCGDRRSPYGPCRDRDCGENSHEKR